MSRSAPEIPGLIAHDREGDLQTQVINYLALVPWLVFWRQNSGLVQTKQGRWIHLAPLGTPDICGYMPDGRALFIELKSPVARTSRYNEKRRAAVAAQERFIARAAAAGCVAFWATSLEQVAERIGREIKG